MVVVIRVQPVKEYAVSLRTDQGVQATHLRYVVVLAQSLQLCVKLMNAVFMCHVGLLCDLFEQLSQECQQQRHLRMKCRKGTHSLPLDLLKPLLCLSLSIRTTAACRGGIPATAPHRRVGPNPFRFLDRILFIVFCTLLFILRFGGFLLPKWVVGICVNEHYEMHKTRTSS